MDEFYKKFKDSINNIPEENPAADAWASFEQFRDEQTPIKQVEQSKPVAKVYPWLIAAALLTLLVATNLWWKYKHANLQATLQPETQVANQVLIHDLNLQLKQVQGIQLKNEAQIAELEQERNTLLNELKMHSNQVKATQSIVEARTQGQNNTGLINTDIPQDSSTKEHSKAQNIVTIGNAPQAQAAITLDSAMLKSESIRDFALVNADIDFLDFSSYIPLRNRLINTNQISTPENKWRVSLGRGAFVKTGKKGRIRPPATQIGLTLERKIGKHFNVDVSGSYMALKHKLSKKDFPQISKDDMPSGAILKQVREIRRAYWFSSGLDYAFHLGKIKFELGGGLNYIKFVRDEYALSVETIDKRSLEINPSPDKKPMSLLNSYLHAGVQLPLHNSWNLAFDVKQYMHPRKPIKPGNNMSFHAGISYLF